MNRQAIAIRKRRGAFPPAKSAVEAALTDIARLYGRPARDLSTPVPAPPTSSRLQREDEPPGGLPDEMAK